MSCATLASNETAFTSGFTEHSHMYERLADHEASKSQNGAVNALAHAEAEREAEATYQRQREVTGNTKVLKCILVVMKKIIGEQKIAFKAHSNESLHTLEDWTVNH